MMITAVGVLLLEANLLELCDAESSLRHSLGFGGGVLVTVRHPSYEDDDGGNGGF